MLLHEKLVIDGDYEQSRIKLCQDENRDQKIIFHDNKLSKAPCDSRGVLENSLDRVVIG